MMSSDSEGDSRPPTSYRHTRRRTERNLLFLVIFVLVVGGAGLIGLIWGWNAMFLGGICLVSGAALIGGLWLLLSLIQKWVGE
jgi:hypothetical protein